MNVQYPETLKQVNVEIYNDQSLPDWAFFKVNKALRLTSDQSPVQVSVFKRQIEEQAECESDSTLFPFCVITQEVGLPAIMVALGYMSHLGIKPLEVRKQYQVTSWVVQ